MRRSRFGNEFLVLVNETLFFRQWEGGAESILAFKRIGDARGHSLSAFGLSRLSESGNGESASPRPERDKPRMYALRLFIHQRLQIMQLPSQRRMDAALCVTC